MSQAQIRSEYGYKWEVLFLIRSKASKKYGCGSNKFVFNRISFSKIRFGSEKLDL